MFLLNIYFALILMSALLQKTFSSPPQPNRPLESSVSDALDDPKDSSYYNFLEGNYKILQLIIINK